MAVSSLGLLLLEDGAPWIEPFDLYETNPVIGWNKSYDLFQAIANHLIENLIQNTRFWNKSNDLFQPIAGFVYYKSGGSIGWI